MLRRTLAVLLTIVAVFAAGWLALRRADVPYDTLEAVYSVPATQFMTLQDGLKIHYTDTGPQDRPALVLVHGFSSSLHTWNAWEAGLSDDYRVIRLDLPGHGLSRVDETGDVSAARMSDVIGQVADKLDVETFTLAGHSMGGNLSWRYTLANPERVDGLILVAASGWPMSAEERGPQPFIFKLMRNGVARAVLKDLDMTSFTRSAIEKTYVDQSFVTEELVQRYVELSRAPGHRYVLLNITASRDEWDGASTGRMAEIRVPTLVMSGREDNLVPYAQAEKFAETIPNAELTLYDATGHAPHEEKAAETLEAVRTFMLDVEWSAMDEEFVEPAGDPRLVEKRPDSGGGR